MSIVQPVSAAIPRLGRVLGVDLGTRRIGVAATDDGQRLATGVTRIDRRGPASLVEDHRAIAALVEQYEAVAVVVGLPRSLSGELGPAARAALVEIEALRQAVGVPVETVDERFSTVTATAGLREAARSTRRHRDVVDQTAAAVFLQSWIDRRRVVAGG